MRSLSELNRQYPQSWQIIVFGLGFLALGQHALPVLDEESYWKIASQMPWGRPYDWKMPWYPFEEQAFVYAHPPLFLYWVKLVQSIAGLELAQWLLGVPLQAVFLYSVHQLFRRFLSAQTYYYAWMLLLSSAAVYLPLTRSLMPDLMLVSFSSFGVYRWFAAENKRQYVLGGAVLGLACLTKYPALLLFLLPFLFPARSSERYWFVLGGMSVVCVVEGWLWWLYGESHLLSVLMRSPEIPRSSFLSRGVGILNRLGISVLPLCLFVVYHGGAKSFLVGCCGAITSVVCAEFLRIDSSWWAIPFGFGGGLVLSMLRWSSAWSLWSVSVLLGVLVAHNYSSPRYWICAVIPLIIQELKETRIASTDWFLAVPSVVLLFLLGRTEYLHARETVALASQIPVTADEVFFTGEWTFRWKMEQLGHSFIADTDPKVVYWARNSAGGVDGEKYSLVNAMQGEQRWLTLVSYQNSTGYYADSLGYFPVWLGSEPLELVEIWKKK